MTMKRLISLFTALVLSLSLIACGEPSTTATASVSESVETSVSVEPEVSVASEVSTEAIVSASTDTSVETEPEEKEPALKDVFAEHGLKVGTCLSANMLGYVEQLMIVKGQFSSVTMENSMKPDSTLNKTKSREEGEIVVEFNKDAIKMLEFARKNGISMRGHTLVWHSQTPNWIFYEDFNETKSLVSREVMLERMETYIRKTFELIEELGYTEVFYAFDVVNEAWMEDGTMRDSNWKKTIGDDYLWYAFYFADKYAPESIDLYYNDYNEQYKTETLIKFAKTLVDENGRSLIDGIGLQAHLYTSDDIDTYLAMIDKLSGTGLKIEMTELDVCLGSWNNPQKGTEDNFDKQGRYYYTLINGIFERVDAGTLNMDALTFWGFSDRLSWRSEYSPLLYDGKLNPKPAYYGAMQQRDLSGFNN